MVERKSISLGVHLKAHPRPSYTIEHRTNAARIHLAPVPLIWAVPILYFTIRFAGRKCPHGNGRFLLIAKGSVPWGSHRTVWRTWGESWAQAAARIQTWRTGRAKPSHAFPTKVAAYSRAGQASEVDDSMASHQGLPGPQGCMLCSPEDLRFRIGDCHTPLSRVQTSLIRPPV